MLEIMGGRFSLMGQPPGNFDLKIDGGVGMGEDFIPARLITRVLFIMAFHQRGEYGVNRNI